MTRAVWAHARLEDLATKVGSGATPRGGEAAYKRSGTPLIRSMNVVFFGFKRDGLAFIDDVQAGVLKSVEVQANDVLLNITGASIGRVTLAPADLHGARVNQHVCIIRPKGEIEPRYLRAFLSSPEMQARITAENYGVTRQALTKEQVLGFEIPLAPLLEQRRIADKLDALLTRVDACRERLDRVPAILKRLRQSVLAAATSGELTREWRLLNRHVPGGSVLVRAVREQYEAHQAGASRKGIAGNPRAGSPLGSPAKLPSSWAWATGADIVKPGAEIVYGIVQPGPKLSVGVPYVRGMDIEDGRILVDGLMRTSADIAERYARSSLQPGDVILGIIRATKVAIVPAELAGANITQGTARFRPSDCITTEYLSLVLQAPATQAWLHAHYRGIDMPGLNLADVRRVPIPLPSKEEQAEIGRRVGRYFELLENLKARYLAAVDSVARLTPSVLAAAFRGELVPQDPNDEPAMQLLERLRKSPSEAASGDPDEPVRPTQRLGGKSRSPWKVR